MMVLAWVRYYLRLRHGHYQVLGALLRLIDVVV